MNLKQNITGLQMLFGLGIGNDYLKSGKLTFSDNIGIQEIIQENQHIGGNLHILIARIIEKVGETQESEMKIMLTQQDLFTLQALGNVAPPQMISLVGVPEGNITADIAFLKKEITCNINITSSNEEVFPTMEASFGFKLGSTSWIDMIKYQLYKPKLKRIITKYRVKQAMDSWLPQEDLSGFDQLTPTEQNAVRERIAVAYAQAYQTTLEQMEQLDIDEIVNKFKAVLEHVLKPAETLQHYFNITLCLNLTGDNIQLTINYKKAE
jgi:hypothetical protein